MKRVKKYIPHILVVIITMIAFGINQKDALSANIQYKLGISMYVDKKIDDMRVYEYIGEPTSEKAAVFIAQELGIKGRWEEDNEEYRVFGKNTEMYIHKKIGGVLYIDKSAINPYRNKIAKDKAIKRAMHFLQEHFMCCYLKKGKIRERNNQREYVVLFYNELDNVMNYGMPDEVIVGYDGSIRSALHHNVVYHSVGKYRLKTSSQALEELRRKKSTAHGGKVYIQDIQLVYYRFEDDKNRVLKPSYRFVGRWSTGEKYEEFICATLFASSE